MKNMTKTQDRWAARILYQTRVRQSAPAEQTPFNHNLGPFAESLPLLALPLFLVHSSLLNCLKKKKSQKANEQTNRTKEWDNVLSLKSSSRSPQFADVYTLLLKEDM